MDVKTTWRNYQLARQRLKKVCASPKDYPEPSPLRASRELATARSLVRKAIDAAREAKRLA